MIDALHPRQPNPRLFYCVGAVKYKQLRMGIAESWTVSGEDKVLTFKLRDAKWSNGDSITAEDFKYSWLRALSPELASDYAYRLFYIKGAESYNSQTGSEGAVGIKVVDPKTCL